MTPQNIKATVALLVLLAAVAFLYISQHPFVPGIDRKPHEAVGEVLAQETIKLLGKGGRVIVLTRDTVTFPNPASDAQLEQFQKTLKQAGLKITATHLLKMNPIGLMTVPPGDFLEILRKSAEADVIVSFLSPPVLTEEQFSKLGEKRPKVVAVCSGEAPARVNLKQMFGEKLLHAVVLTRKNPPARATGSSPRESFEQWFWLATPANLADLPLPAADAARKN